MVSRSCCVLGVGSKGPYFVFGGYDGTHPSLTLPVTSRLFNSYRLTFTSFMSWWLRSKQYFYTCFKLDIRDLSWNWSSKCFKANKILHSYGHLISLTSFPCESLVYANQALTELIVKEELSWLLKYRWIFGNYFFGTLQRPNSQIFKQTFFVPYYKCFPGDMFIGVTRVVNVHMSRYTHGWN